MSRESNLIRAAELVHRLSDPGLVIVDCRFDLARPNSGAEEYAESHIPGSVYCSLDTQLSAPVTSHGGRHPLPSIHEMEERFSMLGIENGRTHVVVYDDAGGSYAARLWWMLRYLGHDRVRLLDGGYSAWLRLPGPIETTERKAGSKRFISNLRSEMLASVDDVRQLGDKHSLVDARAAERYRGEIEPIDVKAGHIPGAVNLPWPGNHDTMMCMLPPESLRERYSSLRGKPIFYCGSGVTSCIAVLAMNEAGYPIPRLYTGSWSDWISWPENPVAIGPE